MLWNNRRFQPPSEDAEPVRNTPGAKLWYLLTTHVPRLLWANLLCTLFCIPIVTIPASLCALHAVVLQYYRIGYGSSVFQIFWKEFKSAFVQKTLLSLLLLALPVGGWFLGSLIAVWASYALAGILVVLALCTLAWFYPQLAILQLQPVVALRNALLLTAIESWRNLLLLLIELVAVAVIVILWPLSLLFLLIFLPVLPVVLMTAVTMPVLEQRLIEQELPSENTKTDE